MSRRILSSKVKQHNTSICHKIAQKKREAIKTGQEGEGNNGLEKKDPLSSKSQLSTQINSYLKFLLWSSFNTGCLYTKT